MPIKADYINELELRHGASPEIDELRRRHAPESLSDFNSPEQAGKKAADSLAVAEELELPISMVEGVFDPDTPFVYDIQNKPRRPNFEFDFTIANEVFAGIELEKQRAKFAIEAAGGYSPDNEKSQQFLERPIKETKWESVKKWFIGSPSDDDVARWTQKGRYEKFHDALNVPTRIAVQYTIGRALQVPQLGWAIVKRIVPETAIHEDVYDMDLKKAMGWAANHNPSGFTKFLGGIAEIIGGAQTATVIGDRFGVLVGAGRGADWGSKALRAEQIGAILATTEEGVLGLAGKIDTGTDYGNGGLVGVASTVGGFGVFSLSGSAVNAGWKKFLKARPKFGKIVDDYFAEKYQKQLTKQAKERDVEFKETGRAPKKTPEQQASVDAAHLKAKKEILEAKKIWNETGDRAEWDRVRSYYAGLSEGKVSPSPSGEVTVKDFGKYPIAKAKPVTKAIPTVKPTLIAAKASTEGKAEVPVADKKTGLINHKSGGFVDLTPLADAGIQARTSLEGAGKSLTRFTGLSSEVKQTLIEFEEELKHIPFVARDVAVKKYGKLSIKDEQLIENYVESGEKTPEKFKAMPQDLKVIGDELVALNERVSATLKDIGFNADWPNNQITALEEKLKVLGERDVPDIEQEIATQEALEKLENIRFLHHTYSKLPFERVKKLFDRKTGTITKKPSGLTGRKFTTFEEAEVAGFKRAPLAVSYADMIESVSRAVESDRLIKAINNNPNLSMWAEEAPEDWVTIPEEMFPASVTRSSYVDKGKAKVRTRRRKYPVPIAEALKELTFTSTDPGLVRAYDEINLALKQIGFYNPLIMTKNDIFQMWRVAGVKGFVKMPQAVKIFFEKGPEYQKLRKAGLFNNAVNHVDTAKNLTEHMITTIRETSGEKVARLASEHLKLQTWINDLTQFNEVTTWNMDQMVRIATYKALENANLMKSMTDFEKIEFTNDALVNYAKLPKATKKHLNRVVFTPSYRVGNFRFLWGQLAKHPWRFKGPILRTIGYKMFIKYGLPALATAIVAKKLMDREVVSEKGYKIVVHNPETNTDTVYSLSDPLLEGAKITQRPIRQTIENNLAALPAAALRYLSGPKRRTSNDPVGEFFKLGTPIYRDIQLWKSKDKTTAQKILTQFAIAYVYQREHKEPVDDNVTTSIAKALSVWTDWRMQAEDVKRMFKGRSGYFGPGGEFDRLIREYKIEQNEVESDIDIRITQLFRAGKDKEAIEFAMNSDRYNTKEGISGRYLRAHAPLAYYWKEFPKEDKVKFVLWLKDNGYDVDVENLSAGKIGDLENEIEKQLTNLADSQKEME